MNRYLLASVAILSATLALTLSVEAQENPLPNPVFPFGAVYFRKSNPPEQDWERDHKTAAQMGGNIFRHWFMRASIENSPGTNDWRDYDRMLELEAQHDTTTTTAHPYNPPPQSLCPQHTHTRII